MIKRGLTRNGQVAEIIGISDYINFNLPQIIMTGLVDGEEVHWNGFGRVKTSEILNLTDPNPLDIVKWEPKNTLGNCYYFTKAQLDTM